MGVSNNWTNFNPTPMDNNKKLKKLASDFCLKLFSTGYKFCRYRLLGPDD
jgi:hypothetical protein